MRVKSTVKLFGTFALALSAHAQYTTFFPQLADGGSPAQRWTSTIILINPSSAQTDTVTVRLFGNDGSPLYMDFGTGPVSTFTVAIPPAGTVTYTSTGANANTVTGWAAATSNYSTMAGDIMFAYSMNGVPQQGVTVTGLAPSDVFYSPATFATGLAIANPNDYSVEVVAVAIDSGGNVRTSGQTTLAAGAHQSFTVAQAFPKLSSAFTGSILAFTPSGDQFVAMAISGYGGVLSSYPVIAAPELSNIYYALRKPAVQP